MLHKCKLSLLRYLLLLYRTHLAFTWQYHKRPSFKFRMEGSTELWAGAKYLHGFLFIFQVETSVSTTKGKVFRKNRHHLPSISSHMTRNIMHRLHEHRRKYTTRLRTLVLSTIYTVGQLRCVLAQGFFLAMFEKASLFTTKIRLPQRSYRWKSKDCGYFYTLHHSIFT